MTTASKATSKATTEISTETNSATQEGVKINLPSLPDAFGEESLLNRFKEAEKEARAEVPDVTTEEGRKHIKEMARKVSASNKVLDTPMRDYLRILKTQPKALEKNARESKQRFEELKADILKPLLEAQASQDEIITWLNNVPSDCSHPEVNSQTLNNIIETINGYSIDLVWSELQKKFKVAHEAALTTATVTLERITQQEKQAAELEELRQKQAKAEQEQRDREIAEEAAEKARQEAEAKAQRDREDVDRRAAESRQREENAKAAEAQAKRDAELAEQKRIDDAKQAKIDAENERVAAEKRQALAVEQAKQAEAKRIADEEAEQAQLAKARAEDKELRIKVNRANLVVLIAAGFSEEDGKKFIRMVAKGELPDIKINY